MSKLRPDSVRDRLTAGKRNRLVTVRRATTKTDAGSGEELETWADYASVWASWRRASAREQLAASEISATVTDVFDLLWDDQIATVTPKDRIVYDGVTYNIEEATELGYREGLRIRGHARADQ